jgi:hypothetical protein
MNLKLSFARPNKPKENDDVSFDTDKPLLERTNYLADCNDIVTEHPLITATSEQEFRAMFGIGENQQSNLVPSVERKGFGRKAESTDGLMVSVLIPNQCMRFSMTFNMAQMHAVIKQAQPDAPLHLDALSIIHSGSGLDIPCGAGGVGKDYLDQLIGCFRKTALNLTLLTDKSLPEQEFKFEIGQLRMLLEVSMAYEASHHAKPSEFGLHNKG